MSDKERLSATLTRMDRCERIAYDHLLFRGFRSIAYEPDGNVPPDFLADEHVAAEVRRLNQNETELASPKGLEETEIPLLMRVQNLAKSFGPPTGRAWWLALRYHRPFPKWRTLGPAVRAFLEHVRDTAPAPNIDPFVEQNFRLEAIARHSESTDMFHVAMMTDSDSGGWVFELLKRNLRLCVEEKTEKVKPYRDRYSEWWLLLIDHIAYGLPEEDVAQFKANLHVSHTWDRVVVVSPLDHTRYFEV